MMSRPAKKPAAMMEPNAIPSLRLVDKPCWAVLTLCIMSRSGTLRRTTGFVSGLFFVPMDEEWLTLV